MPFRFPARWDGLESRPNPLSQAVARRRAAGLPLLDLTVSNPAASGIALPGDWPPLLAQGGRGYVPDPKGARAAREAIARYCEERSGLSADPDDFFLTAGTSEGYSHLFRLLCEAGDEILVPRPSYPLLDTLAGLSDLVVEGYPMLPEECGGFVAWRPDREAMAARVTPRTRAACVVQPDNPTGAALSPEDAAWLLEFAERHGLALIVDEVFADYRQDEGVTVFPPSRGPLVFTLNGLSKLVGLPQLKLAWIRVAGGTDAARAKEHLEWICDAHLSVGAAPQAAAPELLRRRGEFQGPIRARLSENLKTLREIAAGNPSLAPLWPQGGWCVPIRCRGVGDDEAFAIRLVEEHGALAQPGYFYEFGDDETLVISLLTPPEAFRTGLAKIAAALP